MTDTDPDSIELSQIIKTGAEKINPLDLPLVLTTVGDKRRIRIWNFAQIRFIDDIQPGHCRLCLSENHYEHLNGEIANSLIQLFVLSSVDLQGRSCRETYLSEPVVEPRAPIPDAALPTGSHE